LPSAAAPKVNAAVHKRTTAAGGIARTYVVYAPVGSKSGALLILAFHGATQDEARFRQITGYAFERLADRHAYVAAYSDGYENP
jgi:polyhydroxybutyrate depolymerase